MGYLLNIIENLFKKQNAEYIKDDMPVIPPDITKNLLLTIRWTEYLLSLSQSNDIELDYSKVFRKTNPHYEGKPFYTFGQYASLTRNKTFDYVQVLSDALKAREACDYDLDKSRAKQLGKILLFETDITTLDGIVTVETNGFIDDWDIPPIDTWFFLSSRYWRFSNPTLFSWIPNKFIEITQHGIDVEILDSYAWLEDFDQELNNSLFEEIKNGS